MPSIHKRARLYISYKDCTENTTANQNIWQTFPYPNTAVVENRNSGDFVVSNDSGLTVTYTGHNSWFDINVVCNVYKGSGSNANRNVETQWELNGVQIGSVRGCYMNAQDSVIMTGIGQLFLSTGDVLKPKIRNIENDDKINIKSCDFMFKEDNSWGE